MAGKIFTVSSQHRALTVTTLDHFSHNTAARNMADMWRNKTQATVGHQQNRKVIRYTYNMDIACNHWRDADGGIPCEHLRNAQVLKQISRNRKGMRVFANY